MLRGMVGQGLDNDADLSIKELSIEDTFNEWTQFFGIWV
jgi:hypothetical protein